MFEHTITARFDDIDYAGRVFYGRLFNYAHVAEEEWFEHIGYPIPKLADELGVLFPMAHAEGDFRGPIELGDDVAVHVGVESFGTKSFDVTAHAENLTQDHEAFRIDVTRVCLSTGDDGTQEIPGEFRSALEPYQWDDADPARTD
ncbi:acyl-CoA thioesterase [Haloarchaeobius baliensis]|uniref:acyl-CoA thioesterase n=1 Tax=Haloarchaeobius baliensis TaxID=1670458 RepID=UPI003F883A42